MSAPSAPEGDDSPAPERHEESKSIVASGGHGRSKNQSPNQSMPSQMEDVQLRTPPYTSSKTGFNVAPSGRGDDSPRAMDVVMNERFRDEDRFTNSTNDPHIGTHGRKYEP